MTETTWHYITFFPDQYASTQEAEEFDLAGLAHEIRNKSAPTREALPWLKLARFGEKRTVKGYCLRNNANVIEVSGVEAEHDAGTMPFEEALARLTAARIACLIYTSPSYVKGVKERWRVLAPFSRMRAPALRREMVAVLNGVLEGAATPESFVLSQAFYYGRVGDNPDHRVEVIEGDFVDLRLDLLAGKRDKDKKPRKERRVGPAPVATPVAEREIAAALEVIDPDCSYEVWLRVAAALRHQLGEDGFGLFDQWSARADGTARSGGDMYTIAGTERQWDAVATMTDITIGTVFHYANQADPGWRARYEAEMAQGIGARLTAAKGTNVTPAGEGGSYPPLRPDDGAPFEDKVTWLLLMYGYCAPDDRVVELHEPSAACLLKREAFTYLYQAWSRPAPTPRGKPVLATDDWARFPLRVAVRGVRMRPDQPFPAYIEGGEQYKNTYRRPTFPPGGDVGTFTAFLERLVPEGVEREWLLDWMAHKLRRPEIPGSAVIFVADNEDEVREGRFGTGRGLLFRIAHALYGPQYARAQSFNVLDGSSGQSAYTDWIHGSVLVTVDESRTSPTAYRRGERNAVYDVLKDIVDPAPKRMHFKGKYRGAFDGMSYCSFWVATNHADAVAIPEKDRRFTVLRNGRAMLPAEAVELVAWLEQPTNIGALAASLEARDLTGFNMFQPLDTAGKTVMAEMARSEVEDLLRDFMADKTRGAVFTKQHLAAAVASNFNANNVRWHGDFEAAWSKSTAKAMSVLGGAQRRIRVGGAQKKLFCFRGRQVEVENMGDAAARREAAKWGHVDGVEPRFSVLSGVAGLSEKTEEDQ